MSTAAFIFHIHSMPSARPVAVVRVSAADMEWITTPSDTDERCRNVSESPLQTKATLGQACNAYGKFDSWSDRVQYASLDLHRFRRGSVHLVSAYLQEHVLRFYDTSTLSIDTTAERDYSIHRP